MQEQHISGLIGSSNFTKAGETVTMSWEESGRPVLTGSLESDVNLSISHDPDFSLYCISDKPVGCDIEEMKPRKFSQWQFLLGKENAIVFNRIFSIGDPLNTSGYRIWTAMEVVKKSFESVEKVSLELFKYDGFVYSFYVKTLSLLIFTFPVKLPGGSERMMAVGMEVSPGKMKTLDFDKSLKTA